MIYYRDMNDKTNKKDKKKKPDLSEVAFSIVKKVTEDSSESDKDNDKKKSGN